MTDQCCGHETGAALYYGLSGGAWTGKKDGWGYRHFLLR